MWEIPEYESGALRSSGSRPASGVICVRGAGIPGAPDGVRLLRPNTSGVTPLRRTVRRTVRPRGERGLRGSPRGEQTQRPFRGRAGLCGVDGQGQPDSATVSRPCAGAGRTRWCRPRPWPGRTGAPARPRPAAARRRPRRLPRRRTRRAGAVLLARPPARRPGPGPRLPARADRADLQPDRRPGRVFDLELPLRDAAEAYRTESG